MEIHFVTLALCHGPPYRQHTPPDASLQQFFAFCCIYNIFFFFFFFFFFCLFVCFHCYCSRLTYPLLAQCLLHFLTHCVLTISITLTSQCWEHPLKPNYLGKSEAYKVYIIFLIFDKNIDCGCL